MDYTWKEYQQFVDKLKIEENIGDLRLYHYFDTLRWSWCYAIVFEDEIIIISQNDIYPYDFWDGMKTMYNILTKSNKE